MPRKKKVETVIEDQEIVATLTKENAYTPTVEEIKDYIDGTDPVNIESNVQNNDLADQNRSDTPEEPERELTEEEKHQLKVWKAKLSHWNYRPKVKVTDAYRKARQVKNRVSKKMRKLNKHKK